MSPTPPKSAQIPFSDPPWLSSLPSPIFKPTHHKFQRAIRPLIQKLLHDNAIEWESQHETIPPHVFGQFASAGLLPCALPAPLPAALLKDLAGITHLPGDIPVEEFDVLHGIIFSDEMVRSGLAGPGGSITTGIAFGVPPIIKFGSDELKRRFLPDLLTGRKRCCIAITEPDAGSDVANITTTAVKSACGKYYIVNGTKKWISNGIWSHYATMAVRTGPPGSSASGISLLMVPLLDTPGVNMRRLKVSGQISAGTTYITLEDVQVPVSNLLGRENHGMSYIMTNFNHERLAIAVGATRAARVALSSAFEYVLRREAFGKPLIEQPVVRHRLAKAGALLESQWAWIEQFGYQLTQLERDVAERELGGMTALLKANAGMVLKECADTAVLLFGGNGYTRSGQGHIAESKFPLPASFFRG
ncbi:Acyl-CoA dehydrogenase/oxidase, N-terminal and middle domain containing protein [Naviculisporaceae sp. PSN 640]